MPRTVTTSLLAPLALTVLLGVPLDATAAAKVFIVAGVEGSAPTARSVHAVLGQRVHLHAVVKARHQGRTRYFTDAPEIRLRGRRIRPPLLRPLSELGSPRLRWFRVEPRPHHVNTSPPNRGNPAYSNAILFGPTHGKWIGYDTIEYHAALIRGAHGGRITVTRTRPSNPKVDVNGGLGTMRYKVELRLADGTTVTSPGEELARRAGISPGVPRVTFRSDNSFVGHLRGYFNVPNVFGSGGHGRTHQTELYQGADCADVIVGAARAAGARIAYTSVLGFRRHARVVTDKLLLRKDGVFAADGPRKGRPVALRFGEQVRAGDIMLIDYVGFNGSPRAWDHIAVVGKDRGKRGVFDPEDLVLHMGYLYGLTEEPAHGESPAIVQFMRLKPRIQRAMARRARRRAKRAPR
jgi:hypothetical protein